MNHHTDVVEMDFSSEIVMPERSMLFSLQPFGVGTPHQESLLSFLVRISNAHAVNPRLLIREIFPLADEAIVQLPSAAFFQREARTINGLGQYAKMIVPAMEKLTGQQDLSRLTFLPWRDLLPHNGQGLLARHPRWCPVCLEQRQEEGAVAFPLTWSLETYQVCAIHLVPLEYRCRSCGKMQPCIPSYPDLSLCAHCRRPLGGARAPSIHPDFKTWVSEAVGDMVACQSMPAIVPTRERFQEFVREQVMLHAGGNRTAFCRAIGINDFGVSGWLNKGQRPSITQFLTVCYGTKTQPVEIFHASGQPAQIGDLRIPAGKLKERAAPPRLAPARRVAVKKILQEHLNSGAGQSVSLIAKELGVGRACLRYWFPDLCKLLSEQHRTIAKKQSDDRYRQQCMLVEEVVSKVYAEGSQPTKRKVDKLLRAKGVSLSQPHLISTYRECLAFDLRQKQDSASESI
ncbi:TniQ family protein [Candidatus Ferrigenium straubiae]|jgi:hypothetical protein|uniref:TniQ family protein n=1 Tax=Candidatus Ferrigenium straubiae TaxID=2919506 RepID=UPI003F4AE709